MALWYALRRAAIFFPASIIPAVLPKNPCKLQKFARKSIYSLKKHSNIDTSMKIRIQNDNYIMHILVGRVKSEMVGRSLFANFRRFILRAFKLVANNFCVKICHRLWLHFQATSRGNKVECSQNKPMKGALSTTLSQ